MANFLVNSQFFVTMATGSSEESLTDIVRSADLENLLVGARIWGVSLAQAEL